MKIELTEDEIQTTANALFEFVENNNQDITRNKEINKIRKIYKKLYNNKSQKNKEK